MRSFLFVVLTLAVLDVAIALPNPITISVTCGAGCASQSSFTVSVSGGASQESPTLQLQRGGVYVFQVSTPGHPFAIHTAPGQISTAYRYGSGVQNNGVTADALVFLVPIDAPSPLYYQSEAAYPLFGRIDLVGGTTGTIPSKAPTAIETTAPAPAGPARFWTPVCDGVVPPAPGATTAAATSGPQAASPELNPGRSEDTSSTSRSRSSRRKRDTTERSHTGPQETGLGTQSYQCTTSTRAEQLMDLCLFTLVRESTAASETCLSEGPGIFTPVSSARYLMACGVAQFNAWSVFDTAARPLKSDNPVRKRTSSRERTRANKELAMTFAVYNVIKYILPNRAADTATSLRNAYGVDVEQPSLYSFAAKVGTDMANDFIASHLSVDGSNQEKCYKSTVDYKPVDLPVQLGSFESVNASRNARIDLYQWADVRDGRLIGERKFLTPHAYTWRRVGIDRPEEFIPTKSPLPSREQLDAEMRDVVKAQNEFATDVKRKVQVSLWADGPRSSLPPGHWQEIAIYYAARLRGYDLDTAVKLLLLTSVGTYEAAIACWEQKFIYRTVRPSEYIPLKFMTETFHNQWRGVHCPLGTIQGWQFRDYAVPALNTPAFPEYPSGHSTFSNASATILGLFTGSDQITKSVSLKFAKGIVGFKNKFGWEQHCFPNNTAFDGSACTFRKCAVDPAFDSSIIYAPQEAGELGPFSNWTSLAYHAGESRIYGGYHPQSGNLGGLTLGRQVGERVYLNLCSKYIGDCSVGRANNIPAAAARVYLSLVLLFTLFVAALV